MNTKLSEIDLLGAYRKWNSETGPFKCFFRSTNFVSLKHYPDFELQPVPASGGELFGSISQQIVEYDAENTLFFIDIGGSEAIRTAYFIRKERGLSPVLVFNGILHPFGLIGNKDYISNLLGYCQGIESKQSKGYIFFLDNNRYGDYDDNALKQSFNNQYELGEEDLPSSELLKTLGYKRVVYIFEEKEMEDMLCYMEYLEQNEIEIKKESVERINH
jgi:hypothetical protein